MDVTEARWPDLPWLHAQMDALRAAQAAGRLSHAVLIHAPPGTGGDWLALWIARLALCANPPSAPCGECAACKRVLALQHPDLIAVGLEDESKQVRIEQIRDACQELNLTSHQGRGKVAIISPADAMNPFAANALLKTLEEPAPATVLVLVAAEPSRLPPTVRSRCQRIRIVAPARSISVAWLEATVGQGEWNAVLDTLGEAPLSAAAVDAARLAELRAEVYRSLEDAVAGRLEPTATAERWSRSDVGLRLGCFERWLTDRATRLAAPAGESREVRRGAHLPDSASLLNIRTLLELMDGVRELRSMLDTPVNKSLALEALLRRMADVRGQSAPSPRRADQRQRRQ